jgi:hypothetical protein
MHEMHDTTYDTFIVGSLNKYSTLGQGKVVDHGRAEPEALIRSVAQQAKSCISIDRWMIPTCAQEQRCSRDHD